MGEEVSDTYCHDPACEHRNYLLQLGHLAEHLRRVGGDKNVIDASQKLKETLTAIIGSTKKILDSPAESCALQLVMSI